MPSAEATEIYRNAIQADPTNPYVRDMLARIYLQSQEAEMAMKQWNAAKGLAPSWSAPYLGIAQIHTSRNNPLKALQYSEAAQGSADQDKSELLSEQGSQPGSSRVACDPDQNPRQEYTNKFLKALRFSTVVLFKVGPRDTVISGKIGRLGLKKVVTVEWLLGLLLLAALTVTLANTQPLVNKLITGVF